MTKIIPVHNILNPPENPYFWERVCLLAEALFQTSWSSDDSDLIVYAQQDVHDYLNLNFLAIDLFRSRKANQLRRKGARAEPKRFEFLCFFW